jgi:hypothetical protein
VYADPDRVPGRARLTVLIPRRECQGNGPRAGLDALGPPLSAPGKRARSPARDVRLTANHIRFSAAAPFCSLS